MDFNLSNEQKLIRDSARDFAQNELFPGVIERDENKEFPILQVKKMAEMGFLGMMVSAEYGGGGMDTISYVLAMEEISKIDASCSVIMSVNNSLVCWGLEKYGTAEQKEKYLPDLASGKILGAFCLSEPEAGSDAGSLKTTALKKGSGYIINGHKKYITNASFADVFLVMARTDPQSKSGEGVSAFLVDSKKQGIEISLPAKLLGQKGASACEIIFNDVFVSVDDLVGGVEGNGLKAALRGINHARTHVAATCVGQAIRLINEMIPFALGRKQFNKALKTQN